MKINSIYKVFIQIVLLVILTFFWYMFIHIVLPYASGETDIDFLQTKQSIVHLKYYMSAFYLHIFTSLWVFAAGITQFSGWILRKAVWLHRWVGIGYVFLVVFVSAPSALVMSFYANGGFWSKCSFSLLSVLWWWTTLQSYRYIRQHDIKKHGAYIIRSYALALSAVTLRLMQYGFAIWTTYNPEDTYRWVAFPSWFLNALIAEWIIRKTNWFSWIYK